MEDDPKVTEILEEVDAEEQKRKKKEKSDKLWRGIGITLLILYKIIKWLFIIVFAGVFLLIYIISDTSKK